MKVGIAGFARSPVALPLALLALLMALAAYTNHKSKTRVTFTVHSSERAQMQVFHAADGRFAESRSRWRDVAPGAPKAVGFRVRGQEATQLRLDPPAGAVTMVCDMRVSGSASPAQFEIVHVSEISVRKQGQCLRLQAGSGASDPQLAVRFVGGAARGMRNAMAWHWFLVATLLAMIPLVWRVGTLIRYADLVRSMPVLPGFGRFEQWAHWACASLMLLFGLAYVAVTPPGAVPDEAPHLASIIDISHDLGPRGLASQRIPDPLVIYGRFFDYPNNKEPFTRQQLSDQLNKPLMCEGSNVGIPQKPSGYFLHHYLLAAVAFRVGCAVDASFGGFLYSARLLNLLLATVLVTAGVACASRGKLGLFFMAMLPMSLFQMSSLSADSLMFSLGIAWLGVVSGIASGTLQPRRVAAALWGLSLAISLLKPGAAWILMSVLFCKPAYDAAGESFTNAVIKFLVLPWTIHLGLSLSVSEGALPTAGVDAAANIQSLLSDPLRFLQMVMVTFYDGGERLWDTLVGVLGWLDVTLTRQSYWAACLMALAAAFANGGTVLRRPKYVVPLALLGIAGSLILMALPMFIYWTPLGSPTVLGLQGRYFTMTAAFALVWLGFRSPHPVRALLGAFILVGVVVINADAVYQLYDAYFVTGRS